MKFQPRAITQNLRSVVFDHLFLRYCLIGDHHLETNDLLVCQTCLEKLPTAEKRNFEPYGWKPSRDNALSAAVSYWDFSEDFQTIIHEIKYHRKTELGAALGEYSAKKVAPDWFYDLNMVVPIPLHSTKKRARGFNQAKYIAKGVAEVLGISLHTDLLKRQKYTSTQTKLSREERKENMRDAFAVIVKQIPAGTNILLVDDVFTTGSTMNSAAETLLQNGANTVFGFTLASAPLKSQQDTP